MSFLFNSSLLTLFCLLPLLTEVFVRDRPLYLILLIYIWSVCLVCFFLCGFSLLSRAYTVRFEPVSDLILKTALLILESDWIWALSCIVLQISDMLEILVSCCQALTQLKLSHKTIHRCLFFLTAPTWSEQYILSMSPKLPVYSHAPVALFFVCLFLFFQVSAYRMKQIIKAAHLCFVIGIANKHATSTLLLLWCFFLFFLDVFCSFLRNF